MVVRRLHASRGLRHPSAGREDCAGWLRQFFSNYAEPFPHLNIRHKGTGELLTKHFLTSATWPTVMSVFKDYVETESEKGHATVSFNTFRRAWLAAHYEVSPCHLSCRPAIAVMACRSARLQPDSMLSRLDDGRRPPSGLALRNSFVGNRLRPADSCQAGAPGRYWHWCMGLWDA